MTDACEEKVIHLTTTTLNPADNTSTLHANQSLQNDWDTEKNIQAPLSAFVKWFCFLSKCLKKEFLDCCQEQITKRQISAEKNATMYVKSY